METVEVGLGYKGPSKFGRAGFQDGAAWLFRHILGGGRVNVTYFVDGGWPATDYYLVLALSDVELEELGLIEGRGITEQDDDTPWRKDYAEKIYKFLLANGEQLREFLGAETRLALEEREERAEESDPRWPAAYLNRLQAEEVTRAPLAPPPAPPSLPAAPANSKVQGLSKRERKAQRKVARAKAERWAAFVEERDSRKAAARTEEP